jgi:hypothetical protein
MNRILELSLIAIFAAAAPALAEDKPPSDAMKQHTEEGTKGVTPHMTKEKQKELAAQQQKEAMERHMKGGTAGVTPHALPKKKGKKQQAQADAMKQHTEEGTKGVTPHVLPKKDQ